jgi:acetylornithine aminotransferase
MGRTGRWFAHQHATVRPDVMTLAKGLGNGVPIGACLARGAAAGLMRPGSHGSTFGGNPLACQAALAVVKTIEAEDLTSRAGEVGAHLLDRLRASLGALECVKAVRGKGLMVGIELKRPCADLVGRGLARGLLINVTAERVIRLLPPLILTPEQAERIADTLSGLVREFCAES